MLREKRIIRVSWWAILGNGFLAIIKLTAGFISGSFAVVADGIDSATDVASSLVVLLAARIISRPPNVRFPYGYRKADTFAARLLAFFIFFAGAQLAYSTIRILIEGGEMQIPTVLAIWVTVVSIAGKLVLMTLLYRSGRNVESQMLLANARNMRNDILISVSVLVSLVFTLLMAEPVIDRVLALFISGFIIVSGFRIFVRSNVELMDGIEDTGLYNQLFEAVRKVPGAFNPHRVRARKIGHLYMINLDIEVDPDLTVKDAHRIAMEVEKSIQSEVRNVYDIMVHMEPLGNIEKSEKYGITESDVKRK